MMSVEQSVEWKLAREIEVHGENLPPVPLCPPRILHDVTRARSRAAAVGGRRLTAWDTALPLFFLTSYKLNATCSTKLGMAEPEVSCCRHRFRPDLPSCCGMCRLLLRDQEVPGYGHRRLRLWFRDLRVRTPCHDAAGELRLAGSQPHSGRANPQLCRK
jgi:hypothetical protein